MRNRIRLPFFAVIFWSLAAHGDTFTIREDDGNLATVEARLAGERLGVVALERTDGRIEIVPQQQVVKRELGPDPEPVSCETVIERLRDQFGPEKFRAHSDATYVIGLVLSEPLQKQYESRAAACLKKAVGFMKRVEKVFLDFTGDMKLETTSPKYPLVVLIFETDDDFMKFAQEETGGRGLSAGAMLGYYSGLTNRLVIRMSECHTFSTPLHEAIHQQVYNRGLIQRLAPVPSWFNEGIATGFEGSGEKVNGGPLRINTRYVRAAMQAQNVNWDEVVADDKSFRGDVLAGEAYAHAWSIHWFLVTKYPKQYLEYLQLLGEKKTLAVDDASTRVKDFEKVFGKPVGKLQSEFPASLERAARKQKVSFGEQRQPGYVILQSNLGEVEVTAVKNGATGELLTEGHMRNLSYIRPMSFHVTLETDAGTYAEWYMPNVPAQKIVTLSKRLADKRMQGGANQGTGSTFSVKVRSVVPDSETGKSWQRGQLPVPVFNRS